ncbi:MAG TPA: hypothetical protein PK771_01350 [Spirochaetota bacterium]|nr:hypothetical protein [Spirochaetota bacterium]
MDRVIFSNRRIPTRFDFNISGKMTIIDKNFTMMEKDITIVNVSIDGIEIVFSDNEFLYHFLGTVDDNDYIIKIEFLYEDEQFSFKNKVLWINIEDIGERNYTTYSGLSFIKKDESYIKDKHLDLLVSSAMQNIYIP